MDRRQMLFRMMALGVASKSTVNSLLAQRTPPADSCIGMSDRERDGLRGPVRRVISDGSVTEYDLHGNRLRSLYENSKWGDTWTYNKTGRLQRLISQRPDGSKFEESYSYDSSGRVQTIVDSRGNQTTFTYTKQPLLVMTRDSRPVFAA